MHALPNLTVSVGNLHNFVFFWLRCRIQNGSDVKLKYCRWSSLNEDFMHTFSTFVALGAITVNTALLIIVLKQICQCALSASRKRKGQDSVMDLWWQFSHAITCLCSPWKSKLITECSLVNSSVKCRRV